MKKKIIYVVSTPIGNLLDISGRAVYILKKVDLVILENIKHSYKLFFYFGIKTKLFVINNFFEIKNSIRLINKFKNDNIMCVAIISSAGTPLICDPGYFFLTEAKKLNIKIISIPGPSALISSLSVCGLFANKFIFDGFLSSNISNKINDIKKYVSEYRTIILYESSHRILTTLLCIMKILGENRIISLVREITKLYETVITGNIREVLKFIINIINQQKGEFVILISGICINNMSVISYEIKCFICILLKFLDIKKIVFIVIKVTKLKKKFVYNYILSCKLIKNDL
ncbi:MAG: 16S rRNA (cytidine(1402)-2'-O)-methyltransferase [Candidatus Azosocius agrarius]|nr:MAG: 16S rRNA (cytidine(1402)-2'-O)-methyltransferase [Gammaproteobacteria bacterium]